MTKNIRFLPIPRAVVEQNIIDLGKTGSGKSSAARVIVEDRLDENFPVCIIDPKGDWWGIKLSADGKKSGYPIVIFGGRHADIPINETAGAQIAELFATGNRSCVIDMRGWMPSQRTKFFIDFASTLFNHNIGRKLLVLDECHNFAPKGKILDPESGKCLHWANRLANEGRSLGVTIFGLSQRPQKVHNDFLTSCETLIAMRVLHASDREAYRDWIDGCGDPAKGKEMLATIANLKRGSAYVWSPEIGFGPELVHFPMFRTYDSFKPQDAEATTKLTGWVAIDLDEIKTKLAVFIKQAEDNDPKPLRAKLAKLERELTAANDRLAAAEKRALAGPHKIKTIEKPVVGKRTLDGLKQCAREMHKAHVKIRDVHKNWSENLALIGKRIDGLLVELEKVKQPDEKDVLPYRRLLPSTPALTDDEKSPPDIINPARLNGADPITGPEQRILDAIAWMGSIGITQPEQTAVAFLAGYTIGGGAFTNPRGSLRTKGLVQYLEGDRVMLTPTGMAIAKIPEQPLSNEELHRRVIERLPGPERKLLSVALARYPDEISDDELAERTNYAVGGGAYTNPRGRLRSLGLVTYPKPRHVRASDVLFPESV